jgi:hypothetical protein
LPEVHLQGQGQSPKTLERVAHAGLLCIYTLAAVLGLFLHAAPEERHFQHVCGATTPDLDSHDAPASEHEEGRCALCHLQSRLGLALPEAAPAAHVPVTDGSTIEALRSFDAPSAFVTTPPSRAPPLSPAV